MATSARRIRAVNPDLSQSEKFILDADYSGGTSVTVKSNYGLQDNDILVWEGYGNEKSEAVSVSGTTGNTGITLDSAGKFSHQKGTPLFRSEYDQVEISYRTSSAGAWTVLDTIGIKWDDEETIKIHQGATSTYEYRFRFYNSQSGNYSEYSPTISGGGYAKNQIGYLVTTVRKNIKDPDRKIVSDEEIIRFLVEGKDIIRGTKNDWSFWFKKDDGTIGTVASTREYNLDDISETIDYLADVRFRDVTGDDDITYHLKFLPPLIFDQYITDNEETEDDHVLRFTILPPDSNSSSGYIKVDPSPETTDNGSFYVRYYQPDTDYDDVGDTTAIPIPQILANYAIAQCERIKGNDAKADKYESKFLGPSDEARNRSQLTGIALLKQMERGKLQAIKQPKSLKVFHGRRVMSRLYDSSGVSQDALAEKFFSYPER